MVGREKTLSFGVVKTVLVLGFALCIVLPTMAQEVGGVP